jgi:chromosome segregation ATPase
MATQVSTDESVQLHVENIGGITETTVDVTPGVTILTGRNATNRTSLIQAIMAVIGSDNATIRGDADEGRVELTIGDTTYTRTLRRTDGRVVTGGNPYQEDATLADLFAFLIEGNDARQAVSRGEDLRTIIMRPVDTREIEEQIDRLKSQRDDIDSQLNEISRLKQQLPELEGDRAELEEKISDKKTSLDDTKSQIADIDRDIDDKKQEEEKFEQKIEALNDVRSELESVRRQISTQRESLEALRDERDQLESERKNYDEVPDGRIDGIEAEIQRLRDEKSDLDRIIDELQTVIQFNQDLLEGDLDFFGDLQDDGDGNLTDQLVEDGDDLVCWTCGSETDTSQIESMLEDLRELRNQYMDERGDLGDDIDDLTQERHSLEEKRRQRSEIESRLETIEEEIHDREARVDRLTARRDELTDEVETLENDVDNLQTDDEQDELLDLHKEANRLEVEIDRLQSELESIEEEIERIEARVDDRDDLKARREDIQAEIEDLRTRVERLEENAVTQFNNHMESVLDILGYENLERIWIERTEEQVRKGRQTVTEGRFDLHVVRSTESGSVYEDSIDHLSESEREVTGLVFALAGYLVHEVHEVVPFMLLDSVEAIDAPRIADLVEYFEQQADYLIVALLEEDAQALNDDYQRVTQI